jgi:hypoxanthine phosphoribosyltransferase
VSDYRRVIETPAVLFSEAQVKSRVAELGREIAARYAGEELSVVGLMKNCLVFMADLIRSMPVDLSVHLVRATQGGQAGSEIVYSAEVPYEGRHILLLDDVVDTGVTLSFLVDHIRERSPKSLRVCALIDKARDRKVDVRPDWAAFALTERVDHFIVGYGLDYRERYRGLPYIGTISRPAPPTEGGSLALEG